MTLSLQSSPKARAARQRTSDAAPAVDRQHRAGDHLGLVRAQEQRRVGDVLRRREAAPRDHRLEGGALLRRVLAHEGGEQRRLAGDRRDGVDADTVRRELDRHRFRDQVYGALRSVVPGKPRAGADAGRRADVEDVAAADGAEMRHQRLRHQVDRLDVDGEDAVELLLRDVDHGLVAMARAGVVDDDVDAAELADRIVHGALDILPSGDVACERDRAMADLLGRGLRRPELEIEHRNPGAFAREGLGDAEPEALRGAGDEGGLVGEAHGSYSAAWGLGRIFRISASNSSSAFSISYRACTFIKNSGDMFK